MSRDRHPRKELEAVLRLVEEHGQRVTRKQRYFHIWCPCGQHHHSVHLTPSGAGYERNLRAWLRRCECWEAD